MHVFAALSGTYTQARTFDCEGGHTLSPDLPQFSNVLYLAPGQGVWLRLDEAVDGFAWPPSIRMGR